MFTGIIEALGEVKKIMERGTNRVFWVESPLSSQLTVDQSLAHNGVCLTIEEVAGTQHRIAAVQETLEKTTLSTWESGRIVNLERSLAIGDRLDGHWVQGHVDTTAQCLSRIDQEGSWLYRFSYPPASAQLLIEKGSVAIDGISLTIFALTHDSFSVAVIPYTFAHTSLQHLQPGMPVNLEFDVLGKYVNRIMQCK